MSHDNIVSHCAEAVHEDCGGIWKFSEKDARTVLAALGSLPAEQRAEIVGVAIEAAQRCRDARGGAIPAMGIIAEHIVDAVLSFLSGADQ